MEFIYIYLTLLLFCRILAYIVGMIIAKFGGTAMTPQNFSCLKRLVNDNCGCVVVSAIGKEYFVDTKVTDLLKQHFEGKQTAWPIIEDKFRRLVEVNSVSIDVDALLFDARERSLKFGRDYCLSLGEELTAKIASKFLACDYIEAQNCITFHNGKLHLKNTLNNLQTALKGVKRGVLGGFYGGCATGREVFSRGGGDVTGALVAVATGALYQNWTDVCGVRKANPKRIQGADALDCLSYAEMYALAKGGAEVLHPSAVKYCEAFGIPIVVSNYLNEFGQSTIISNCPSRARFLSVTEKQTKNGICATLLHGFEMGVVCECVSEVMHNLRCGVFGGRDITSQVAVNYCRVLPDRLVIETSQSILPLLYNVFHNAERREGLTICRC